MDKYHAAFIDKKDSDAVRDYLGTHPDLYEKLFRHWLDHTVSNEERDYRYHHVDFQSRILLAAPPLDFPETLLTWAAAETVVDKATFLFEEAAHIILRGDPGAYSIDLVGLCNYVDQHPIFADIWERKRISAVPRRSEQWPLHCVIVGVVNSCPKISERKLRRRISS